MTEEEYWMALEFRVCRELEGMKEKALRSLWCDGFIPEEYVLVDASPRITGWAWMGMGPRDQGRWAFELLLGRSFQSREDVPWASLLPADDFSGWLDVDLNAERLRISPPVGVVG